jgi:hypothetical protein
MTASLPLEGTLRALQQLDDGPFHLLCDALIRRASARYRDLQPHGINDPGQSIKGQPDSFVGDTAADCSIATCYSTQRGTAWPRKAVDDVAAAGQACPRVEEILVASARDVSRELPKSIRRQWVSDLHEEHHDLRREYLGIPYSRLNLPALIASAKASSRRVLERLNTQGRFLPGCYSVRSADRELYDRWQSACDPEHHSERRATLVPVVSGAGMGKTNLVAHFVSSFGDVLPIVFMEGRRLSFADEQALVRAVITELQGVLSSEQRSQEEASLVHHLGEDHRLTVVIDAIDEARAPAHSVIQALEFWLESRLGRASVLIASSRPDFWRLMGPERWRHFSVTRTTGRFARLERARPGASLGAQPDGRASDAFRRERVARCLAPSGETVAGTLRAAGPRPGYPNPSVHAPRLPDPHRLARSSRSDQPRIHR